MHINLRQVFPLIVYLYLNNRQGGVEDMAKSCPAFGDSQNRHSPFGGQIMPKLFENFENSFIL